MPEAVGDSERILGSSNSFELRQGPVVCVGSIVIDGDHLLLIRRGHEPHKGMWSVPGGRVSSGETLVEAVVRETHEEAGLEIVCGELVGHAEIFEDDNHFVVLDFRGYLTGSNELTAGDDADDAKWVKLSDISEMELVPGLVEFLHDHGILSVIV